MPAKSSTLEPPSASVKLWRARTRNNIKSLAGQYPVLYLPFARWKRRRYLRRTRKLGIEPNGQGPVQWDTDVVIEGFPRSANTFAVTAFELAQPSPLKVAHHLHVPSQIIAAAKLGIPALVLVRDPQEAVLSLALWLPYVTLEHGLRDYLRFHRRIIPYRDHFVVACFEEVSTDFGGVIRRLNARFGTSFKEFEHTEANVARCFEHIEQYDRDTDGRGRVVEARVARPSAQRDAMKDDLRAAFGASDLATARAEAYGLYELLSSG